MTSRDFCFWLQGYFELTFEGDPALKPLDQDQVRAIKNHLALVFKHEIDPSAGPPAHQADLNAIHASAKPENKVTIEATPHWQRPQDPYGPVPRC